MEYFVSAENTPYYHWQLELLIESAKENKCENNLLVALAQADAVVYPEFFRNLSQHRKIFGHENIGKSRGYEGLNSLYSLLWSVRYNKISQPFLAMPAHSVIFNTSLNSLPKKNYPEIIFSPSPFFTIEFAEETIGPFWEWIKKSKEDYEKNWVPAGSFFIFQNIPVEVFERTVAIAERIAVEQIAQGKNVSEYTCQLAWAISLCDFMPQISLKGDYSITGNMLGSGDCPIIDYEHGLPPVFNKRMFQYQPPTYVSFGDPFEILSQHSPTQNSHFISRLAKSNMLSRLELKKAP